MKMRLMPLVFAAAIVLPAWASQPGQPLDATDWAIVLPGISTQTAIPFPCYDEIACPAYGALIDNESHGFSIRKTSLNPSCGPAGINIFRWEIVRIAIGGEVGTVARLDERCLVDGTADNIENAGMGFDATTGKLAMTYYNRSSVPGSGDRYPVARQKLTFSGFTPLFEILRTYTPTSTALGFRVPAIPEGLHSADHFDTFWGRVTDLPDFTRAQPMQCHYPATPPSVGDYVTVPDTSPLPGAGRANYIVTAVTNGTQRRYGRQRINGVMSGRDPQLLPACQ